MNEFIQELLPTFSLGVFALSFLFKIYKRSVSSFLTLGVTALIVNLHHYHLEDCASIVLITFLIGLLFRAMMKPTNDKWFYAPYRGDERRNNKRVVHG